VKTLEMAHAVAPLAEYAQDVNQEPVISGIPNVANNLNRKRHTGRKESLV
jgi:hypothetical protein